MLRFAEDLRVYLHREPVDFRCGINTLAALVENSMRSQYLIAAFYGDMEIGAYASRNAGKTQSTCGAGGLYRTYEKERARSDCHRHL